MVNTIASHHGDAESVIAVIVAAADALRQRPGAIRNLLKAISNVSMIWKKSPMALKECNSFALQAGREIRIMVNPDKSSGRQEHNLGSQSS